MLQDVALFAVELLGYYCIPYTKYKFEKTCLI
jgi:hypothetical protein